MNMKGQRRDDLVGEGWQQGAEAASPLQSPRRNPGLEGESRPQGRAEQELQL